MLYTAISQKYTACNGHAGHDCEDASEGNVCAPLPVKKINAVMQGLGLSFEKQKILFEWRILAPSLYLMRTQYAAKCMCVGGVVHGVSLLCVSWLGG